MSGGPVSKKVLNVSSAISVGDEAGIYKEFEVGGGFLSVVSFNHFKDTRSFRLGLFEVPGLLAIQPSYEGVASSNHRSSKHGEDKGT